MNRTLATSARRWLSAALLAAASAAALLPGTAAAGQKHAPLGAPRHAAPHAAQRWNGAPRAPQPGWNNHRNVRPQPGRAAPRHAGWHGRQPQRAPIGAPHHARTPQRWHAPRPVHVPAARNAHAPTVRRAHAPGRWHARQPRRVR